MKEREKFLIFFLLSLLVHFIFLFVLNFSPILQRLEEAKKRFYQKENPPLQISLLELPPTEEKPDKATRLGPQTHKADRETKSKFLPMESQGSGNAASFPEEGRDVNNVNEEKEKGEQKTSEEIERLALLPKGTGERGKEPFTSKNILDDAIKEEDTVNLNTTEFKYISYFSKLKRMVENVWTYPYAAIIRGEDGTVTLRFTIERDGSLSGVEVVRSSGSPILDSAAVKAVKDASPYPPLPESWKINRLNVVGEFHYILGYRFVR